MSVVIVEPPAGCAAHDSPLLSENRLSEYPEFQAFFRRGFDLDTVGLSRPGCVRAGSGELYLLIFLGRSGEAFPSGFEIHPVVNGSPADAEVADRDLSAILQWTIEGSGQDRAPTATPRRAKKRRA